MWVLSGGTGRGVSTADAKGWMRSGQRGSQSQSAEAQREQKLRSPGDVKGCPVSSTRSARYTRRSPSGSAIVIVSAAADRFTA